MTRMKMRHGDRIGYDQQYNISEYRAVSPFPAEEFYVEPGVFQDEVDGVAPGFFLRISGEKLHPIGGTMCEMYDKCVGRESSGRHRRAYHAAFTEAERKKIGSWKAKFWTWEMRSGYPLKGVAMTAQTWTLLQRAGDFFASV